MLEIEGEEHVYCPSYSALADNFIVNKLCVEFYCLIIILSHRLRKVRLHKQLQTLVYVAGFSPRLSVVRDLIPPSTFLTSLNRLNPIDLLLLIILCMLETYYLEVQADICICQRFTT